MCIMEWRMHQVVILFTLLLLLISVSMSGQNFSSEKQLYPKFRDLFNGLPFATPNSRVSTDIYFDEEWKLGTVILHETNDTIKGFLLRYNIYLNEIEIRSQSGIRALANAKVKRFTFQDSVSTASTQFVNSRPYTLDEVPLLGFFELLVDGQVPLLKRHTITIKEPDYIPALNTGSRDMEIKRNTEYYVAFGSILTVVKGKKKLLEAFGQHAEAVNAFMKTNYLHVYDQNGLIRILEYYNTLLNTH